MKISKIYNNLLLATFLLLGACKKELNVFPTSQEVDGGIITDTKSASTALNGVYYRFVDGGTDYNSIPSTLWYEVNEETPSQLSGMLSYTEGGGGLDEHTYTAKTAGIDAIWNYGYALVNAANGFLKNITPVSNVDAADKKRMIAEAKFLRAFGNGELLLYYGQYDDTTSEFGNILRDEFVTPDNIYLPRSSVGATYDSIIADLDNAIPDLPSTNSSLAYANEWAAKLLKARILINRGAASDYAEVISLTSDIISNSPFALETNVKDLFWSKGFTSNEVMLSVQPYATQTVKWTDYISYDSYGPNDFMDSLFNGDPRADWMIQTVATPYGPLVANTKYYPGSVTDIAETPLSENSYAFRLTEAYLLKAEATAASGGSLSDAKTLLKTILTHAGVTDFSVVDAAVTASDVRLQVISEEMRSFVEEAGLDWFALRRLPFATVHSLLPSILNKSQLLLPVPEAEITSNGKIKQNPNY